MFRSPLVVLCLAALPAHAQDPEPIQARPQTRPEKIQQVEIKGNANAYDPRREARSSSMAAGSRPRSTMGEP